MRVIPLKSCKVLTVGRRTLVVLFPTMSVTSGSQGLTDFPNKGHPFYTKVECALCYLEWSDDILMTSWHSILSPWWDLMMSHDTTMATMVDCCQVGSQQTLMSQQETGNHYLLPTNSRVMNIMTGFEQQLEVRHRYLTTARTHALTGVPQTPTSAGYQFKILCLHAYSL